MIITHMRLKGVAELFLVIWVTVGLAPGATLFWKIITEDQNKIEIWPGFA